MILDAVAGAVAWANPTGTSVVSTAPLSTAVTLDLQLMLQAIVLAAILGAAKFISRELKDMKSSVNTLGTQLARMEQWAEDHQSHYDDHVEGNRHDMAVVNSTMVTLRGDVSRQIRDEVRAQRGGG